MSIFEGGNWNNEMRKLRRMELEEKAQNRIGPIVNVADLSNVELEKIIERAEHPNQIPNINERGRE